MKKEDFTFKFIEEPYKHKDCWFKISGDTEKELTQKYMEQSMISVNEAVYSLGDNSYGLKRLFPFNFDVIEPNDEELKKILKELAEEAIRLN